jgi:hypothetical protein
LRVQPAVSASQSAPSDFLGFLASRIVADDWDRLQADLQNQPTDVLDVAKLRALLASRGYPTSDFYEYVWTIYEIGLRDLGEYPTGLRVWIASLYVYCNKRKQWAITIDSDYWELLVAAGMDETSLDWARQLLRFTQWMLECTPSDDGYEDYYALLSLGLLQRIAGSQESLDDVLDALETKGYATERLLELTVTDGSIEAWLDVHRRAPSAGDVRDRRFERVITGC